MVIAKIKSKRCKKKWKTSQTSLEGVFETIKSFFLTYTPPMIVRNTWRRYHVYPLSHINI